MSKLITLANSTSTTNRKVTSVPATSKGSSGDLAGDYIYDGNYLYKCVQNYSATTSWVVIANATIDGTASGSKISVSSTDYPLPSFLTPTVIPRYPGISSYELGTWTVSGSGEYASPGTWTGISQDGDSTGTAVTTNILVAEDKASVSGNTYTLTRTNAPDIWIRETVTW